MEGQSLPVASSGSGRLSAVLVRVAVGVLVLLGAIVIAVVLERRRREHTMTVRDSYPTPRELFRSDFSRPEAPWLVAMF